MSKSSLLLKFLLDANLSPETAQFLRKHDFDVQSIQEQKLGHLIDEEIIKLAKKERRIVITFDYDFAELWYFKQRGEITVIHLRTRLQTVEFINKFIYDFLNKNYIIKEGLLDSLIILEEDRHRVVRY